MGIIIPIDELIFYILGGGLVAMNFLFSQKYKGLLSSSLNWLKVIFFFRTGWLKTTQHSTMERSTAKETWTSSPCCCAHVVVIPVWVRFSVFFIVPIICVFQDKLWKTDGVPLCLSYVFQDLFSGKQIKYRQDSGWGVKTPCTNATEMLVSSCFQQPARPWMLPGLLQHEIWEDRGLAWSFGEMVRHSQRDSRWCPKHYYLYIYI